MCELFAGVGGFINKKSIPNHNCLVGGFLCQDYSVARIGAKGIEGKNEFYGGK